MKPHVSIVIVTWNNENDIKICLDSVLELKYKNFSVVVVDNNSTDFTVKYASKYKSEKLEILAMDENLFLTGGNNVGISHALKTRNPEYVMVLNPDTKVEPDLLDKLVETLERKPEAGAAGPKLKFFNNEDEGKINSAGLVYDGFMHAYDIGFGEEDKGQFNDIREVFGVTGACILFRGKMLKEIGLYWERIKLYLDEVELFIRAKKKGWKVIYNGQTTVWHSYMKSTSSIKLEKLSTQKRRTWLWIALRHYPLRSKLAVLRENLKNA